MFAITSFRKSYHHRLVLDIPQLKLGRGIFWVRGANGSGKSTLLKTLAGILHFEGDIFLNEHISIKKHPVAYRKRVNFAEAEPVYPEFLTGMDMVRLFATAKEAPAGQEEYFLESMGMKTYINEPLGTYSSGMLKKLSIALAFLGDPRVILLDEPLITLDARSLELLYQWIEKKYLNGNVSFFLSSHQPLEDASWSAMQELLVEKQTVKLLN